MTSIAIGGIPGSGKTTLAAAMAGSMDADVVHLDEYFLDRLGQKSLTVELADGTVVVDRNHPDNFDSNSLAEHLKGVAKDPVTIVEGHFILALEAVAGLFDYRIWIDTPRDVALARKIIRQHDEGGRTMRTAGEWYLANVRPAIEAYLGGCAGVADLVIDGMQPTDRQLQATLALLLDPRAPVPT